MAHADLYEDDFYLWALGQAEALRARGRGANAIDYERLAEEVEDMGKSELHACESQVLHILVHLFKLAALGREEPTRGWRTEIATARVIYDRHATTSIRRQIEPRLEKLHKQAATLAQLSMSEHEPDGPAIPAERRWTLGQILGETDDPIA